MAPLDSPAQRSVLEPQMSPLSLRMFCFALFVRKEKKKNPKQWCVSLLSFGVFLLSLLRWKNRASAMKFGTFESLHSSEGPFLSSTV